MKRILVHGREGHMPLPFTRDQFLEVFQSYNAAIGLTPMLLLAVAVAVVALAYSERASRHRLIPGLLAVLFAWSGVVYHWGFFATINPAAKLFGALFVAQAVLLVVVGVIQGQWRFDPRGTDAARLGWVLIVYALVIYPLLGKILGHGYPRGPSFGAPCPTTIFFLGTTLWMVGSAPVPAAIPVVWSLIGTGAAVGLGMYEDFALILSAAVVVITIVRHRTTARHLRHAMNGISTTGRAALGLLVIAALSSCARTADETAQPQATVGAARGEVAVADDRTPIQVDDAVRGAVLKEMRVLLNAVQGIVGGAARGDTGAMRTAAASAGMAAASETDDRVAAQLGSEFMLLGMRTHATFDSLAADVAQGKGRDAVLGRLSTVMGNCVGCHNQFRLVVRP